jgi:tetratricopeptide (TPR) repeat protein
MTRSATALLLAVLVAGPSSQTVSRMERLEQWLTAIERHEPGTSDPPALLVRSWNADDLRWLWIDLNTVIKLMRDPDVRLFFMSTPGRSKPTQYVYSGSELRRLLGLALREAPPRAGEGKVERQDRVRASENRLLKHGAVLHADISMFAQAQSPATDRRPDPFEAVTIKFKDGRRIGIDDAARHWQTARTLLDAVVPDPSRDEMVLLWYRATTAQMQIDLQLHPRHLERALQLFPADADLLFFNGCHHEALATTELQSVLRTLPREMNVTIGSERSELRQAETFFRRALAITPNFAEARIRLGRVMGLQGRHAEAADQMRLVAAPTDPLLAYYRALFLGAEVEALGQPAEARAWYERATALYPSAQSPLLALSQLAQREADRPGATRALEQAFQLPADDEDRLDPWWTYHMAQGRDAGARQSALYRVVPSAEAR